MLIFIHFAIQSTIHNDKTHLCRFIDDDVAIFIKL